MNKIAKVKNYICSRVTFRDMILSAMKVSRKAPSLDKQWGQNRIFLSNLHCANKKHTGGNYTFSIFLNDNILIGNKAFLSEEASPENTSKQTLLFWNRSPGARYPKKANNGARPDCRSVRKIRKRLKTGK
ncbi:conserved Plasmodium protein, unknown function [Plasmodium knowlesi strain H]|uniref:Uncharacterized protein n=3 Tax=Plasmodium knowlesi TaxID=5850 RepID=A0A5K1UPW1_PLAKH|nr:conserved Plasmodium protein, unknown function [Plasmodium knowlesi strain H]OTN67860.1 Uncharacterized protein PKNOH_S05391600 [Plasmodium knowlesi]CAA9990503.1 conserved Plasmodium protein, unknown function [Plasmodium knowlesi strain H]SBO19734.1 conserved Plasmodium protein, unknown function [Plasmodium knowlesi strain H]SBO22460.1 conserved Plasmodium protein, unknown function [Plasmodium knowlesi strain H]VVS79977.1 conserved Plasmodium protein, unknown function [Plasmodium knowlesi s|eukprot:XP_002260893.1 hypothetical protein, conserved in Plasmodium species [Plasmodium knowlesi strain H]